MQGKIALMGLMALSACGPRTNPENGPVILLCRGEEVNRAADGEIIREHKRAFYRVDGRRHTLELWDDTTQTFGMPFPGLTVSPTQMEYDFGPTTLAGVVSTKTITFDRAAGRVAEQFAMGNGGTIVFDASCKPVKSTESVRKF